MKGGVATASTNPDFFQNPTIATYLEEKGKGCKDQDGDQDDREVLSHQRHITKEIASEDEKANPNQSTDQIVVQESPVGHL